LKEAAHARGYDVVAVITEQASSLNERRRGMKKLLTLVGEQAVDVVLIEYPDRLVRFGFSYLDQAFQWQHVRLEVLDQPQAQEPTEELIRDMLAIVTVFAGRLYHHLKPCQADEVMVHALSGHRPGGRSLLEGHPGERRPGPYASEHTRKVVGLFLASRATLQPGSSEKRLLER
jgi:DNA invertase Pin-like site-specific DNA recombinase